VSDSFPLFTILILHNWLVDNLPSLVSTVFLDMSGMHFLLSCTGCFSFSTSSYCCVLVRELPYLLSLEISTAMQPLLFIHALTSL